MKLFFQKRPRKQRVLLLKKRHLAIPAALLAVCALCLVTTLPTYVSASATTRQLPIYCVQRDYKVCSLSFDAAWGEASLRRIFLLPQPGRHRYKRRPNRKEGAPMHTPPPPPAPSGRDSSPLFRVERQFDPNRPSLEMLRSLLQAHWL